ncbi:hypothetical protein [Ottowia sp.]|uniref:DUF7657 domain-containing protein n=1 Tax=Ottowia sp. TaxID=1898956 RepID=UPI00392086A6
MLSGLLLALGVAATAATAAPAGRGHVDGVALDGRQMTVAGWAASEQPELFVTNLIVNLDGRQVYRGRMQGVDRPDVAQVLQRPDWRGSGFSVRFMLPQRLPPGSYTIDVSARRGDGSEFPLAIDPVMARVTVAGPAPPSNAVLATLLLAAALPLAALVLPSIRAWPRGMLPSRGFAWALAASFALLVALGVTGSSLALLLRAPTVTAESMSPWFGQPQIARSDEWEVLTPLALAQGAHVPRWPVLNRNLGEQGQNMLVMGMTGLPVAHLSALAKPATWGHFVLDPRRALAWTWWLPIIGALGALWCLFMRLTGLRWQPAAALAAALVLAPYSVGFSFWPAYLVMFAALGLLALDRLLHASRTAAGLAWGGALGWSAAGYALVLYPAWQISLATLCVPLALAWAWRERTRWHWRRPQTLGLLAALALAATLLLAWWLDAREAVAAMRETVYPGRRVTEAGGDIDLWFLLKGWLNPFTLHVDAPMVRSEAASFQFLWLPTLVVVAWRCLRTRRADPVALALLAFALFALTFQFIGFPRWLARLTWWDSVTSYRVDLALGVAQLLLIGWWLAQDDEFALPTTARRIVAAALALAVLAQATWESAHMPLDIADGLPRGVLMLAAAAAAGAAALWVLRHGAAFIALYLGWTLAATLSFNPLGQAPAGLTLTEPLRIAGLADDTAHNGPRRGVAVIGQRHWAMTLPAAGVPVVNNVFYYPQPALWARLDPAGRYRGVYNRYHRLLLELAPLPGDTSVLIESPRLDEVRLTLDPARFDFRLLGASHVLAPVRDAAALGSNPTLALQPIGAGAAVYTLFEVRP